MARGKNTSQELDEARAEIADLRTALSAHLGLDSDDDLDAHMDEYMSYSRSGEARYTFELEDEEGNDDADSDEGEADTTSGSTSSTTDSSTEDEDGTGSNESPSADRKPATSRRRASRGRRVPLPPGVSHEAPAGGASVDMDKMTVEEQAKHYREVLKPAAVKEAMSGGNR